MPDALSAWSRWMTGKAGDLAAAVRAVPTAVQALLLTLLAAGLTKAVYSSSRRAS